MKFGVATIVLAASLALCSGQRFASNQLDTADYDYQDSAAPPRPVPVQRSYSPTSARINAATAASIAKPTPVPILKQINRHNDDGSYTYGYEGADGSFKIETKLVSGEVMGKYGYVDDSGKVRVVEYGANRYGFQPAGEGITVAPPTLVDETRTEKASPAGGLGGRFRLPSAIPAARPAPIAAPQPSEQDYDDGQYYEEPAIPTRAAAPAPLPPPRPAAGRLVRPALHALSASPSLTASQPLSPASFFSQSTNFGSFGSFGSSAPASPRAAALRTVGPTPPRAQIAGAQPVPISPAPVREHQGFSAPSYTPPPTPSPAPAPQNLFVPQIQQQQRRPSASSSGGLLDQLARDYALPQSSSQTVVDTSFGLY